MRAMRTRVRAALPLALPLLLVSGACTSTPYLEPDPYRASADDEPEWRWMPQSWDKLDAIETWLVGAGPRIHPELVAEAELLLAEGRLEFAREEADVVSAGTLRTRVAAAESGLRRVLADPFADESLKARARRALGQLSGVRSGAQVAEVAGGVLPRNVWGARAEDRRNLTPTSGRWRRITVHHSALEAGSAGRTTANVSAHAIASIQEYHMDSNGWGDIGYHFLIDPEGRVFAGRSLHWQGAHAGGAGGVNNVENIGVCLLGNFEEQRPTPRAITALQGLLDGLRSRYGIASSAVVGHKSFKSTECPGRFLQPWVEAYRRGGGGTSDWPVGQTARASAGASAAVAARPSTRSSWSRSSSSNRVR